MLGWEFSKSMVSNQKFWVGLTAAALSIFITGCGVTLSPDKRKPVEISPLMPALPASTQKILVRFENTLPDAPLTETVWDNVNGAFADASESKQIGYTQNYSKLIPAAAIGGAAGGAIGGAVAASYTGTKSSYTRIVIPFGRIFQETFASGLQKIFPNASTYSVYSADVDRLPAITPKYVINLHVTEFQVWEQPLNHLNLKAAIECEYFETGSSNKADQAFTVHKDLTGQSIGSVLTTSGGFIAEMNKISDHFAAAISEEILKKIQEQIGG
jgi:hypothetical protein